MNKRMAAADSSLTPQDFDWLRTVQAAADTKRDAPAVPTEVAGKLRAFGFLTADGRGAFAITDRGRGALLEQNMRDAEDR